MNRLHLFHDSNRLCSKRKDVASQVEQDESPHWVQYLADKHVHRPRKDFGTAKRTGHYQPNYSCGNCSNHLQAREYGKLGNNLIKAHDTPRERRTVSEKGCCYLCLLCLQLKCRNGFKSNGTQSVIKNGQKHAFMDPSESDGVSELQLFSDSFDGLVDISRYLPQGPKGSLRDWGFSP